MPFGKKVAYQGRQVTVLFQLDRKGIAALAVGPEMRSVVQDFTTTHALPAAQSISPVRTGDYISHFEVGEDFATLPPSTRYAASPGSSPTPPPTPSSWRSARNDGNRCPGTPTSAIT